MVIFSILFCFVSEGRAAGRQFSDKSFHTFEKSRMSQLTRCRADLFLVSCDRKRRCYRYYFTDGDMHTAQHSTAQRLVTRYKIFTNASLRSDRMQAAPRWQKSHSVTETIWNHKAASHAEPGSFRRAERRVSQRPGRTGRTEFLVVISNLNVSEASCRGGKETEMWSSNFCVSYKTCTQTKKRMKDRRMTEIFIHTWTLKTQRPTWCTLTLLDSPFQNKTFNINPFSTDLL